MEPSEIYDTEFKNLVLKASKLGLTGDDATQAMKNLETFSKCRPPKADPEPIPTPVPTTAWEKFKVGASCVWDNETTRTLIKAGGSLAGVALVVYTTVHKDHVVERQAIAQANQRPS